MIDSTGAFRAPSAISKAGAGLAALFIFGAGLGELAVSREEGAEQARHLAKVHRTSTRVGIAVEVPRLRGDNSAELHPAAPGGIVALDCAEWHAPVSDAGQRADVGAHGATRLVVREGGGACPEKAHGACLAWQGAGCSFCLCGCSLTPTELPADLKFSWYQPALTPKLR